MAINRFVRHVPLTWFLIVMASAGVFAQALPEARGYEPVVGQEGKDVEWVPTPQVLVDKMLNLARVTPNDFLIDLGSGDGRIVITAAKRGARAHGIEYNPGMVALSRRQAAGEGVAERATFVKADLFESDLSKATVITLYLLPEINLRLRPSILNLQPGTRIVSSSFDMGDWNADQAVEVTQEEGCQNYCKAYLWIVPAKIGGRWKLSQGELVLKQTYQMISGELAVGAGRKSISDGRLSGDRIRFRIGDAQYTGRVTGDVMDGIVTTGDRMSEWRASRPAN